MSCCLRAGYGTLIVRRLGSNNALPQTRLPCPCHTLQRCLCRGIPRRRDGQPRNAGWPSEASSKQATGPWLLRWDTGIPIRAAPKQANKARVANAGRGWGRDGVHDWMEGGSTPIGTVLVMRHAMCLHFLPFFFFLSRGLLVCSCGIIIVRAYVHMYLYACHIPGDAHTYVCTLLHPSCRSRTKTVQQNTFYLVPLKTPTEACGPMIMTKHS